VGHTQSSPHLNYSFHTQSSKQSSNIAFIHQMVLANSPPTAATFTSPVLHWALAKQPGTILLPTAKKMKQGSLRGRSSEGRNKKGGGCPQEQKGERQVTAAEQSAASPVPF